MAKLAGDQSRQHKADLSRQPYRPVEARLNVAHPISSSTKVIHASAWKGPQTADRQVTAVTYHDAYGEIGRNTVYPKILATG